MKKRKNLHEALLQFNSKDKPDHLIFKSGIDHEKTFFQRHTDLKTKRR